MYKLLSYSSSMWGSLRSPIMKTFLMSVYHLYSLNQPSNNVPILLDGVSCRSGSPPPHLIDCSHNGIGSHNCSHNEDIGLVCLGGNLSHGV